MSPSGKARAFGACIGGSNPPTPASQGAEGALTEQVEQVEQIEQVGGSTCGLPALLFRKHRWLEPRNIKFLVVTG